MRSLVGYYLGDFADTMQWSFGYRTKRARVATTWLPAWFLELAIHEWTTLHSDRILAAITAAGYPLGTEEFRRVGTFLRGLCTAAARAGCPSFADGRHAMSGVRYNPGAERERLRATDRRQGQYGHVSRIGCHSPTPARPR